MDRYPANPNGSAGDVAGISDATGLVLGLMPHPEDHILDRHDPLRGRAGSDAGRCLPLFEAGVAAVKG
ncbi:MAG: phosphoribosylformylglycinamidine synthase subunit PurQ [Acidimicrobiales bacterium]